MRHLTILGCVITSILMLMPFNTFADFADKLVLYVSFEEGKGDKVKDQGPLGLEGKIIGKPVWVKGKFGNALEFEGPGGGQYVDFGYKKDLEADKALTVMAWIFANDWRPPACCNQVWGFGVHGGCGGRVQHGMFQEGGLKIRFEAEGGAIDVIAANLDVNKDVKKWVHVAVTYNDGVGRIYVDGKLSGEGKGAGALKKSNEPFFIAADCERVPQYNFSGIIDEFAMHLRVLSEKEIGEHLAKGGGVLAVEATGKLATRWGAVKSGY
ncbi:LamG domain-containing protein [Candidatus Poribacteria bacterium]|nr:LamG domain-containing protein [Candidatus Poribacteria bacterium]